MRCLLLISIACFLGSFITPPKKVKITVKFVHTANGRSLEQDGIYTNPFGENYSVSQLKYYVSNFWLIEKNETEKQPNNIHLVNAFENDSIQIETSCGSKLMASFMLGVDSINNCSGAQSGALDPLNGMFWTWNSGYVYFKLEGNSGTSKADQQRIQHHIGGYKQPYRASRMINLPVSFTLHKDTSIQIELNLDHYWQGKEKIKIAADALIMQPGVIAMKAADNFEGIFRIKE